MPLTLKQNRLWGKHGELKSDLKREGERKMLPGRMRFDEQTGSLHTEKILQGVSKNGLLKKLTIKFWYVARILHSIISKDCLWQHFTEPMSRNCCIFKSLGMTRKQEKSHRGESSLSRLYVTREWLSTLEMSFTVLKPSIYCVWVTTWVRRVELFTGFHLDLGMGSMPLMNTIQVSSPTLFSCIDLNRHTHTLPTPTASSHNLFKYRQTYTYMYTHSYTPNLLSCLALFTLCLFII